MTLRKPLLSRPGRAREGLGCCAGVSAVPSSQQVPQGLQRWGQPGLPSTSERHGARSTRPETSRGCGRSTRLLPRHILGPSWGLPAARCTHYATHGGRHGSARNYFGSARSALSQYGGRAGAHYRGSPGGQLSPWGESMGIPLVSGHHLHLQRLREVRMHQLSTSDLDDLARGLGKEPVDEVSQQDVGRPLGQG